MLATFRLLNAYFWRTIYGPILAFVFPVILLAILGHLFRLEYVYPGIIALSMLFLGVIALPLALMELKGTSLFKYIGSSPVKPMKFTFVAIGFYALLAIIAGIIICLATMVIYKAKTFPDDGFHYGVLGGIFSLKGFFSFYIGSFIHLMFVIITGVAIATFAKTPQQALTIGLIITIPTMFLSGMVISVDVIASSDVLNWVSRFMPFRYSTGIIVVAATPLDQLEASIDYWLHIPYKTDRPLTATINGKLNDMFHQLIWPWSTGLNHPITKANPEYYNGIWDDYDWKIPPINGVNGQATLFFQFLFNNWHAMELTSNNNMFDWISDFGARKIPEVDSIKSFVTNFFKGYDNNGNLSDGKNIANHVSQIAELITGQGDDSHKFAWLEMFMKQSNILYYNYDKILNFFLPIAISSVLSYYIYRKFHWTT